MFGIKFSTVLLITSVVTMGTCHSLTDTSQAAPSGISHSDVDIMAVVEQLKVKIINMKEHYDDTVKEIKKHYNADIQEIKIHYDGEILELKDVQTTKLKSHEAEIMELKESLDEMKLSHDETKSSLDEMKASYDAEILALKESYNVMQNTYERLERKYDQFTKGYISESSHKEIEDRINEADGTMYPNELNKDRVNKNRNKSVKSNPQTEITSPQQKYDPSVGSVKSGNSNKNPEPTTNSEPEQVKQILAMSGHNLMDLIAEEGSGVGFAAFQAYMSVDYIGNPNDVLVFDDDRINIGSVYVINRGQRPHGSCGTAQSCTSLRVNGVHISHICSMEDTTTSSTEMIQLVAGDEVWLESSGPCDSFEGTNYCTFSGYLLIENI